ncbi:glucan biosynthesis protein [Arenibacterium halophilum]|uniref:Glucan biosynthesis protein G n=1 Tax=Arenibacterium halophilum TaxID=2583821 RepID=A0ABY2X974_9RHOB|nr:glucan biosynthesis protein G [Arenibacterium halophilum]TMV12913.1 glucan biosynthesis protein G [Arenibacterium halophilum]
MTPTRRAFLTATTALALAWAGRSFASDQPATPFSRDTVIDMARELASREFRPRDPVPQAWQDLTYEQYRAIWFRPTAALWVESDRPYAVDFFAPGLYFKRPVRIDEVVDGQARILPFQLDAFDRSDRFPDIPVGEDLGFSGFRLRTEMTEPGKKNEFCVFQGASYFRAIGYGQIYGQSARGLAINTAEPEGEEFPDFIHFWLEAPAPGQRNMVVHALMDSPSLSGAYRFDIRPGPSCVMDVEAVIFTREQVNNIGLGALTSMFLFDSADRTRFDDFRPAVHDTDGLMVWNGAGEALWRPLANPRRLQVSSFVDHMPRGFGLMQRARDLADFDDFEAKYHRRPGTWIEPKGDWGPGSVTLVEIPADKEIYDNIVAYWRPRDGVPAGERTEFAYRLTWGEAAPVDTGVARVMNTSTGKAHAWSEHENGRIVAIEFEDHPMLADPLDDLTQRVSSGQAVTTDGVIERNPETGAVRLVFQFDPGEAPEVELRAQIRRGDSAATEVWLYRWTA